MSPAPVLSSGVSGININIVWVIPNSISQVYFSGFCSIICACEWLNKGKEPTQRARERERKRHQLQPPSCTSAVQRIYKLNQRLVSQTAFEGTHCDCENDWDLINSLHRLFKVHICLFRLLRINQLSNRKGNSLCGCLQRRDAYKRRRHYFKCVLLNVHFMTCVPSYLTTNYIISRFVAVNSTVDTRQWSFTTLVTS